ncbi:MAG TPA: AraC family transcriptional regulator [Flavobacterium sp.]|nr:AraC family transcriptional regulator [Flavobacterium sp.]
MKLTISGESEKIDNVFFVASKIEHKLLSTENQLTILINPLSAIGHQLHLKLIQSETPEFSNDFTNQLIDSLSKFEANIIDFNIFCSLIAVSLNNFKCSCENENHPKDDRIIKALEFMDRSIDTVYSLEEVAEICYLSPSRFLHLFKEKTGFNFRRYQLWNKLVKSLPYLTTNSITFTAHTFGFTDSSHYTRTFKETFGVNPKFMFQKE